jgi:hypothetical protein
MKLESISLPSSSYYIQSKETEHSRRKNRARNRAKKNRALKKEEQSKEQSTQEGRTEQGTEHLETELLGNRALRNRALGETSSSSYPNLPLLGMQLSIAAAFLLLLCCFPARLHAYRRPDPDDAWAMARWLVRSNYWGVIRYSHLSLSSFLTPTTPETLSKSRRESSSSSRTMHSSLQLLVQKSRALLSLASNVKKPSVLRIPLCCDDAKDLSPTERAPQNSVLGYDYVLCGAKNSSCKMLWHVLHVKPSCEMTN